MRLLTLEKLRWSTIVLAISNLVIVLLGGFIIFLAYPNCDRHSILLFLAVSLASCVRIVTMVQSGIAQEATAKGVLGSPSKSTTAAIDTVDRRERRTRYQRWLWWTRFAAFITVLQFVIAIYLIFHMAGYLSQDGTSGRVNGGRWRPKLLVLYTIVVCFVSLFQCFAGPDVLRWRSFYLTQDNAWKAHYREVFDHGIREALCCLGRAKYLSVMEEDEVYSVAQLLGDLVAYRSSGTGHLELLAGLALLQRHSQSVKSPEQVMEAPEEQIQEAASLHKFAEAAYTGPLLDLGRNPFSFPCAWLYRQGILSPWSRNRLPKLDGDNWWRGHAAAFLNYVKLSPEVVRKGRINQAKCQAAYFVVVLHHLKSVVITVRGTETPEDLITDGLCRECILSEEDLDGLLNSSNILPIVNQKLESSFPHYAHSGIIGAARELFMQLEGNSRNDDGDGESEPNGLLSSLMGAGCECHGYKIRIVGHSLGGAIAAMLGLRLYSRYPNLHVYSYGPLPCVDSVVANACANFVTSIVHNNEFSARLSISSITRLRSAAIKALSQHTEADSTMIFRLARQFLYATKVQRDMNQVQEPEPDVCYKVVSTDSLNHNILANDHGETKEETHEFSIWTESETNDGITAIDCDDLTNPFSVGVNSVDDTPSQFRKTVGILENSAVGEPPEMYIPGLLIHIVPEKRRFSIPLWNSWRTQNGAHEYKAYITNRERFKDITVSPSMFLDHLPWRCHYALEKVLEARILEGVRNGSPIT